MLVDDQAVEFQIYKKAHQGSSDERIDSGRRQTVVESCVPKAHVAELTGFSRRTLYHTFTAGPVHRPRHAEREVIEKIRKVALAKPSFGVGRAWAGAGRGGQTVDLRTGHRSEEQDGLLTKAHFRGSRLPRTCNVAAKLPDQAWFKGLTDVLTTGGGSSHLMTTVDACTKEAMAWDFPPNCSASEALAIVERDVLRAFPESCRADGLVPQMDCSSQLNPRMFRDGAGVPGVHAVISEYHIPEDSGPPDSCHGRLKADYLWASGSKSVLQTITTLGKAINNYNCLRPHASLGHRTPTE
jgi:hypothetical protein